MSGFILHFFISVSNFLPVLCYIFMHSTAYKHIKFRRLGRINRALDPVIPTIFVANILHIVIKFIIYRPTS